MIDLMNLKYQELVSSGFWMILTGIYIKVVANIQAQTK